MIDWPFEILPSNALRLRTRTPDDLGTLLGIGWETCFDAFASMYTPENMRACPDTVAREIAGRTADPGFGLLPDWIM